jgi:hypothetical protein
METNEALKTALLQETEGAICKLMEQLECQPEGDLNQLEQTVMSACLAIGQRWLEKVLNAPRAEKRPQARRQGACGHQQRLVGERPKQLLTLMGKVTVRRPYYQCLRLEAAQEGSSCSHGQAPFDEIWGIEAGRTSPGVQQLVSYLGASMTLEEASAVFQTILPLKMSARQVLNLMHPVGEKLICCEDEQKERIFEKATEKHTHAQTKEKALREEIERMYIELDGVLARMRRGSVPMEVQERKRQGDVYREIKVGAVFLATRGQTHSKLAPGTLVDAADPIEYVARRTTAETFGQYLYALAQRCGIERAQQVVVLGDGAAWIWRLAAEHFPGAVQIVDLWHAREHVWKVAHAVFGRGNPQAAAWAKPACDLLSEGKLPALLTMIEQLPAISPEPGAARSVPEIEADYFRSNALRMRYPIFRAQGMQIGSGVAEAACKTVVSTRAKRAGMRWTPDGLDAVLALRTAVLNGTYHDFWKGRPHLLA